jgi:pimeloyl-ACP methyl ester carboxylesterase
MDEALQGLRELSDRDRTLKLADGRALAFRIYGEETGAPVFYFHGFPGSRVEAGFVSVPGLRLISPDRPGCGASSPQPGRHLADWPKDVAAIADRLGIERFGVIGVSGGGPYALAAAWALPERVTAAITVGGLGPPEAPGMRDGMLGTLFSIERRPWLVGPVAFAIRRLMLSQGGRNFVLKRWGRMVRQRSADVPVECAALSDAMITHLFDSWRVAIGRSAAGLVSDARIYGEDWPFALSEIGAPVHLWHGEMDRMVPVSIGRYLAGEIAGVDAHFTTGEGHFSTVLNALPEITRTLIEADRS